MKERETNKGGRLMCDVGQWEHGNMSTWDIETQI